MCIAHRYSGLGLKFNLAKIPNPTPWSFFDHFWPKKIPQGRAKVARACDFKSRTTFGQKRAKKCKGSHMRLIWAILLILTKKPSRKGQKVAICDFCRLSRHFCRKINFCDYLSTYLSTYSWQICRKILQHF